MNTELLKKIESRCEEVGDCLEWQGHISAGGSPRMYHDGKTQSARKLVLKAHGKPCDVPPKHNLKRKERLHEPRFWCAPGWSCVDR